MRAVSRLNPAAWLPGRQIRLKQGSLAEWGVAGVLLALATLGFFWQILFTPDAWMPAGGGDLAPFLYPNYRFAAHYLRQGIVPLWNPHLYSGAPFAADIQSGLFYPLNLLVFLLVPNLTYQWLEYLAVFHFWLAGFTMYLCLRLLRPDEGTGENRPIKPMAAFSGALAFQFSDLFIVHFGNLNMIAVAAWLPLVFLLFHRSLVQQKPGLAAAGGAVLAVATLAGHIQITLFIILTLGLYALWHVGLVWPRQRQPSGTELEETPPPPRFPAPPAFLRPLLFFTLCLGVTIGLSALLLFPAYEMSRYTPRAELPYPEAARYSLHPAQLIGLFIPNYFGRDPALHWGPWDRVETGYMGVITLLLALIGTVLGRGRLKFYLAGLGVITLLLAMGDYTPLHGWLYLSGPGFDQLRAPARFILLLDFGLAGLAAFGLDRLLEPLEKTAEARLGRLLKVLTWSLGGLMVMAIPLSYYAMLVTQDQNPAIFNRAVGAATGVATFAFFGTAALVVLHLVRFRRLPAGLAGLAVILLIGLDLFSLGHNVDVGHTDPVAGFEHPAAQAFLAADPNLYRIEVTTDVWHLWQPNTALLHGLYDAWGLYNPLTLADTTLYWSGITPRSTGRYNFLGIKYIIASKAGAPADGRIVPVFNEDPAINIYLNQDALPRLLLVGEAQVVADHDAAWQAIRAETFDPATMVILEGGSPLQTRPTSTLSFLQYDLDRVRISVETDQPGYLVLSDAYYPGWQATVDDRAEPIRRANYAFRAVYVPAGQHTVEFVFQPLIWKFGLAVSGVTLAGLTTWAGRAWRKRRSIPAGS